MRAPADDLHSELDRIASDPGARALFRAELDRAIAEHFAEAAELTAFTEAAAEALQTLLRLPPGKQAA
uniref:Transcriptional regulator n=1 Tax=Streptomyces sp. NBC_00008 TaxID=2903610 RepID=A0AAU2VWI0_9ACTN